jgi:AraC family transcriptional regulator of adaptative response/methylated-DNA-[protein]-cysteine methyltransferase
MKITSDTLSVVRNWLLRGDFASLLESIGKQKRILGMLTALTYDPDPLVSDRAIQATGLAAKPIAQQDPEFVRNYILRLFWLVNDESGGICWRAPELIGEILFNCPHQFSQFHPMLISLLDLEHKDAERFRAGTLWAIGRVAQAARSEMLPALPHVQNFLLNQESTEVGEMAKWCLEHLSKDVS